MRRGYATYTTVRAAVLSCALWAGAAALILALGDMSGLMLAPPVLWAGPALLMIIGLTAGLIPMALCLGMTLAAFALTGPALLVACAALYLLPALAAYGYSLSRPLPFWRACALIAASLLLGQLAIYLLMQRQTQGMLFSEAGMALARIVGGLPYRDDLLYSLVNAGFLRIPASMRDTAIVAVPGGYALSTGVTGELLLQVRTLTEQLLEGLVPELLITVSGLNALLGLSLGIRYGVQAAQKRAFLRGEDPLPVPDLGMPPLRTWHLPRPWGLRIGLMAIGYPLMRYGNTTTLITVGSILFQVFSLCFAVQGLATLNDAQHRRGTSRGWRSAVVVLSLLFRFMQIALIFIGVMDQIKNTRGLRPPMRPRDEEEE